MSSAHPSGPFADGNASGSDGAYPPYPPPPSPYPGPSGSATWPGYAPTAATADTVTAGYPAPPRYAGGDPNRGTPPYAPAGAALGPWEGAPVPSQVAAWQPAVSWGPADWEHYAALRRASSDNALGSWALGLGIAGIVLFTWIVPPIIAIILGAHGLRAADRGTATNRSAAMTGLVLGIVGCVLLAGCVLFYVLVFSAVLAGSSTMGVG